MNEKLGAIKSAEISKSGHLTKGIKPIMACIGSYDDYGQIERRAIAQEFSEQLGGVHNVNYEASVTDLNEKGFLNAGIGTYVISKIDNFDKFSEGFYNCTGLIVAGKDRITGKNISFLSHQDSSEFLKTGKKNKFIEHLKQRLLEIQNRCEPGTIDAVIVGGNYIPKKIINQQHYLKSIKLLSEEMQKTLGFEPIIINGPKTTGAGDNVYYDNYNRRFYFIRPKVNPDTGSFVHSETDKEKEKWEEGKGKKDAEN